jgi:Cell wall-associated hydrolases (invasion-associated proteins)
MSDSASGARVALAAAATLLLAVSAVLMVLGAGGANASPSSTVCGGGGTGHTIIGIALDAEQLANARTIVTVTGARRLAVYAAVIAVDVAYTESGLHNSTAKRDHDSEGLFQQRVSIYTKPVADDPVRATTAFLDRLITTPNWQAEPVGVDAQAVQRSAYPDRYQPNAPLAQQLVGRFWPDATATIPATVATPSPAPAGSTRAGHASVPGSALPAVCAGGGGALPGGTRTGRIAGPHGDTVAGTTHIPPGLVINGSPSAVLAVRYALAQLGKPYLFGAAGPDAYDCSGLTMAAWAAAGIALPHLAAAQVHAGTPEPTDLSQAVAGDLVFIPGSDGTPTNPGHVGVIAGYLDRPDGRHVFLLQAAMTGLPVELTETSRWSGLIVAVRHIA